jgi:CheY-like chemotaxis protein
VTVHDVLIAIFNALESRTFVDTHRRFSYISLALHNEPGGKADWMQDSCAASAGTVVHPSLYRLSHILSNQTDQSVNLTPDTQTTRFQPGIGKSALVVDDVADVTEMLAVLLSHAGYQVVTAASARAALDAARQRQFDVIISDIGMPEMNGYQLAREMRTLPGYATVPMVAVTGYSMFDDKERSTNAGFNAHMTKPIDPRALLDLIEQL